MDDADRSTATSARKRVFVVDIGGSHVKLLVTGADKRRKFLSGSDLEPEKLVREICSLTGDWRYDAVSIGYPVLHGSILAEPHNLGCGWVGFDFESAFGCPVRVVNDAAMQALGGYRGGFQLWDDHRRPAAAPPACQPGGTACG